MNTKYQLDRLVSMGHRKCDLEKMIGCPKNSIFAWLNGHKTRKYDKVIDRIYNELVLDSPDQRKKQAETLLKKAISDRDFSREEIAELLGVSVGYIEKVLRGGIPSHIVERIIGLWGEPEKPEPVKVQTQNIINFAPPLPVGITQPPKRDRQKEELEQLTAENKKLRAELEQYKTALAQYAIQSLAVRA